MNYYVKENIPELHLKEGNELINEGGVYVFKSNFSDIGEERTVEGTKEITINSEYVENTPEYFEPEFVEEVIQSPTTLRSIEEITHERDAVGEIMEELTNNVRVSPMYYETINVLYAKYVTLNWVLNELNYE